MKLSVASIKEKARAIDQRMRDSVVFSIIALLFAAVALIAVMHHGR